MDSKSKVIELLSSHPKGLRQVDIARMLGLSRSRVSEIVKELEQEGIVERIKDEGIIRIVLKSPSKYVDKTKRLKLGIIWSSEYPFISVFAKLLRRNLDYDLKVIVYDNGIDATWDLVVGRIDLALTPLITQIYYGVLTNRVKIIGGGAFGGASVFYNPKGPENTTASSKISTMELCLTKALKELGVTYDDRKYFDKGNDIVVAIALNKVMYAAVWEPLALKLRRMGYKEIYSCTELGLCNCCTLASTTYMDENLVEKIKKIYDKSIELFKKDPNKWLNWYSMKTGIDVTILRYTIKNYEYTTIIDVHKNTKLFEEIGIRIPKPSVIKEIVYTQ